MTRKRMEQLLGRESARIRRRFLGVVARVKSKRSLAELEAALEGGTISEVLDDFEKALGQLAAATEATYAGIAAEVTARLAKTLDAPLAFDATNQRAIDYLQRHRAKLVTELTQTQRDAVVEALVEGNRAGVGPRTQAAALRDSIGLTQQQAGWVTRYRARLEQLDSKALTLELRDKRFDGTVTKAIDSGKALTPKQVDRMVARYADKALAYRAEVIARTEALRALHMADEEATAQVIDSGEIAVERVECSWHARMVRTRHSHATMNGQRRAFGEAFTSGAGYQLKYPGDPDAPASETAQCVCLKRTRILPEGQVYVPDEPAAT